MVARAALLAFGAALALSVSVSPAGVLEGRVARVVDGDTFDIALHSGRRQRVRLGGIDAPELDQPHGRAAKAHLRQLALRRPVSVATVKRDPHGRWVGSARIAPPADCPGASADCKRTLDLGLAQLSAGLAWHYRRYAHEQDPVQRARYAGEEHQARARRAGLWSGRAPVPPWQWRHRRPR